MAPVVAALLAAVVLLAQLAFVVRSRREAGSTVLTSPAAFRPAVARPTAAERPSAPSLPAGAHRSSDPVARFVELLRTRRWARRSLSLLSVGLLIGAVAMLGYPFYTNMYQSRLQTRLDRQLASPELEQAYRERRVEIGDSLTRIIMDDIGVSTVVVQGTTAKALRAGAGHYPSTPLPCEPGNVAIAGHRTTYGKPFHNLDLLQVGSKIVLETPLGSCTYEVTAAPFVVSPTDLSVLEPSSEPMLTLTTCHPKGSASKRLIVQAKMVAQETVGV